MPTGTIATNLAIGGISSQSIVTRTAAGEIGQEVSLPKAQAGTLSTRTGDTEGVATLGASHGVTTAATVDVYWSGGVRYGVTVGTVSGTTVPLTDSGAGDVYPAEDSAITVAVVTTLDVDFDGDKLVMLSALTTKRGNVDIRTSAASVKAVELLTNEAYSWAEDAGVDNPLSSSTIDCIRISNGDSANTSTGKVALLYDSDT